MRSAGLDALMAMLIGDGCVDIDALRVLSHRTKAASGKNIIIGVQGDCGSRGRENIQKKILLLRNVGEQKPKW